VIAELCGERDILRAGSEHARHQVPVSWSPKAAPRRFVARVAGISRQAIHRRMVAHPDGDEALPGARQGISGCSASRWRQLDLRLGLGDQF
jgi:hypothetical protein